MKNQFAVAFRDRFNTAFQDSDYTSLRALSNDSNLSDSRVHAIVSGGFDDSPHGPGFFSLVRLCENLGVTPDYLAGISDKWRSPSPGQALNAMALLDSISIDFARRPTIKELSHLYLRGGQRIEAFQAHMDYCDIYAPLNLETRRVKITATGPKSLSTVRMGQSSPAILQHAYDNAPEAFQEKIFAGHERAWNAGFLCEVDSIDERVPNKPLHVKLEYIKVSMRLQDAEGNECLALFCEPLPQ